MAIPGTFLYFAYGSNLLKKRIRINNPSAQFIGPGRLDVLTKFVSTEKGKHAWKDNAYSGNSYLTLLLGHKSQTVLNDVFLFLQHNGPGTRMVNPWNAKKFVSLYCNHQLDFMQYSPNWRGTSATIVPTEDNVCVGSRIVWGAVWRIHNNDMPALDKQEGVDTNWYFPKTVTIHTPDGSKLECRTYQQSVNPPLMCGEWNIPPERRPSITYLECIVNGAIECELPEDYIQKLKNIPHNGQEASPEMIAKLKN